MNYLCIKKKANEFYENYPTFSAGGKKSAILFSKEVLDRKKSIFRFHLYETKTGGDGCAADDGGCTGRSHDTLADE